MNQEQKDSHIETAQGSGNGIPPITGHPPTQHHADDNDETARKAASSSPIGPSPDACKAPVSPKKLETNRKNAQKSTGPRTEEGKAKAAANGYKHGFFAKHLFLNMEQWTKDKADYETVANGVIGHYQPQGYMENFWAEKIATEALRLARLIQHEQRIWDLRGAFENRSPNTILRCLTTSNRQMFQAIQELERLQAKRKAAALLGQPGPAAASTAEEFEEPTSAPDGQTHEGPSGSVATAPELYSEQSEPSRSEAAPHENCGTNPPTAAAGEPIAGSAPEVPGGVSQVQADSRLSAGSAQQGQSAGTKPPRSLADEISKRIDDEDVGKH
jgi:hypothetical protein